MHLLIEFPLQKSILKTKKSLETLWLPKWNRKYASVNTLAMCFLHTRHPSYGHPQRTEKHSHPDGCRHATILGLKVCCHSARVHDNLGRSCVRIIQLHDGQTGAHSRFQRGQYWVLTLAHGCPRTVHEHSTHERTWKKFRCPNKPRLKCTSGKVLGLA
jgi:hypothetical protein